MIYITIDLIAVFLMFLASLFYSNSNKILLLNNDKMYVNLSAIIYRFFIIISCSLLVAVSAFRYEVGTDFDSYANRVVNQIATGISNKEILFQAIVKLSVILGSTQWIFIITSVIIVVFLYKAILDQSKIIFLSVFLIVFTTFYNFSLNAIRQAMATAIFLYAIKYIAKKQFWPFLFWIIVAAGFHKMALIYVPIYFLRKFKIDKTKKILFVLFLAVLLSIFQNFIRNFVITLASYTQYANYVGSQFDNLSIYIPLSFLILNILITLFIFFSSRYFIFKPDLQILIWIQLIATVFSGISFSFPAGYRIIYLLIPIQIILIPNLISVYKSRTLRNFLILAVIIVYFAFFYFFIIYANYNETLPYQINTSFLFN